MKFSSASPKTKVLQRRERWRRDHAAAQTVASAFPQVQCIHLDLNFTEAAVCTLAPQAHVLHPAARAFFDFPCPYADCDGHFDLNSAVTAALPGGDRIAGSLQCTGERFRGRLGKQLCLLHLDYQARVEYRPDGQ